MTLKDIQYNIAQVGVSDALVNAAFAGSDLQQINSEVVKEYPFLFSCPTGQHKVGTNTTTYTVTLYYIDRLLNDSSNDTDIMSEAVEVLKNIILKIGKISGVIGVSQTYNVTNYVDTEALADRCAGAYATIEIITKNDTTCGI